MALFHTTLKDAENKLEKGDINGCLEILKKHEEDELREQSYFESSLYSVRLYLRNYIGHLTNAINNLKDPNDIEACKKNIMACIENIQGFEEAIKGLLKREGELR